MTMRRYLADGLRAAGAQCCHDADANMKIFAKWPRRSTKIGQAAGAKYYVMDGPLDSVIQTRLCLRGLVCDWSIGTKAIDQVSIAISKP